ncbi:MAG: hypothetical protein V2B15_18650 [Bacteroidota bacterium]
MKYLIAFLFMFGLGLNISGQERMEGKITYITSQHVYVNFASMGNISEGDTLFIMEGNTEIPALQVMNLSSLSCVCIPLGINAFEISDPVYSKLKTDPDIEPFQIPSPIDTVQTTSILDSDTLQSDSFREVKFKQDISGRISVSSYSNFYNNQAPMNQRMRYTFSMRANNLGNSKFSAESYMTFSHSNTNWDEVRQNIFTGLKIYNLSAKYEFDETMYLSLGRKINPKISSVGAIDGLQFEKKFRTVFVGAIAGSRPDYKDYRINLALPQYGVYFGHEFGSGNGNMQNTLAYIEQRNHSLTDRRFAYFQHTNTLVKNLFLFVSAEVDLYKNVNDTPENVFNLSNTYVSLRYRIIRPFSIGLSYSARRNVIYYETYKDFLERLLETETLQGWRFRVNYKPAKTLFLGLNAGYRFRKEDPRPSKNVNGYLTYSQVPGIGASVTLSATWLETSYLNGIVYGAGISRAFLSDKLQGGIQYRYVDYLYQNTEIPMIQHVGEASISWAVYAKLSLSAYYEGTFEKKMPYHRVYFNITQRF